MGANDILARLAVLITANTAGFSKDMSQANKSLASLSKGAENLSGQLKTLVAGFSLISIGKEVIDVTSSFQKFEAVLTNTLGSNSAAQKALSQIKDFAAATPFSVEELTSSFVKLANQGFVPTTNELRKLGDLSSSVGKSFDQLAEAIIDAQTGEFERLKEFGIRAKKQGDQVTFTFKGVETQTKFTSDAIREYVLSLGDLEGVSGSMAAISQTLGGKISNLGDAFDSLLLAIGNSSGGPLNAAIESLITLTNAAANLKEELSLAAVAVGLKDFNKVSAQTLDYLLKFGRTNSGKAVSELLAPLTSQSNQQFLQNFNKNLREFTNILKAEGEDVDEITVLWDHYVKKRREGAAADQDAANQAQINAVLAAKKQAEEYAAYLASLGLIEKINLKIEELENKKKNAFSIGEIAAFNNQISKLKDELALLNAAAPLSGFGKRIFADAEAGLPSDLNIPKGAELSDKINLPDEFKLPEVQAPDVSPVLYAFDILDKKFQETGVIASDSLAKISSDLQTTGKANLDNVAQMNQAWDTQIAKQQAAADAAADYGSAVGDALGSAISGQESFADAMKKLTAQLLQTFLARALGGIISSAATSGGPPPVAIALAAAGVAAITSLFRKATGFGGGGGSASAASVSKDVGTNVQRAGATSSNQFDFAKDVQFRVQGNDLVAVLNNQQSRSQITG